AGHHHVGGSGSDGSDPVPDGDWRRSCTLQDRPRRGGGIIERERHLELLTGILATTLLAGGVLALAAMGEVLAERVGVVNLGAEGLMAMGAMTGVAAVTAVPSPALGFAAALAVGALFGAVFALATVTMRANQVLCG